jgi:hypothetical protein
VHTITKTQKEAKKKDVFILQAIKKKKNIHHPTAKPPTKHI